MKYFFQNNELPISGIKRKLTLIKKKGGVQTSYIELMQFLASATFISLEDGLSIFERYIEYAVEMNLPQEQILNFIESKLEKYMENELNINIVSIARLYSKISADTGITFINKVFNKILNIEHKIDLLLIKSDLSSDLKFYDNAFISLRQASDLGYHIELPQSLGYRTQVAFKMADIGKLENKSDVYLNYSIDAILYGAACLLTNLPHIYPYFRTIEDFENKTFSLYNDEYFVSSSIREFGNLNMLNDKIIEALKKKMFPIFGISNLYCNEQILKHISLDENRLIADTVNNLRVLEVTSALTILLDETKEIKIN